MSKFKVIDRGEKDTILLIPGWAADYRIFDSLNIRFNYLVPTIFSPKGFTEDLLMAMKENGIKNLSVLGWSMGAFVACDILRQCRDRVDEVILVGARKQYEEAQNDNIKVLLANNKKGFLRKFYHDCFSADEKDALGWFKENLLKDYLERMGLESLIEGLDYLSEHEIDAATLEGSKVTFVHGRRDKIAPAGEAAELMSETPRARCIWMDKCGHVPFIGQDFKRIFDGYSRA